MKKGYTLVELMIVTTIIGIMASIAIPSFARVYFDVKSIKTETDLIAIETGVTMYVVANNAYPTSIEQLVDYVSIGGLVDKYELNPNLNGGV